MGHKAWTDSNKDILMMCSIMKPEHFMLYILKVMLVEIYIIHWNRINVLWYNRRTALTSGHPSGINSRKENVIFTNNISKSMTLDYKQMSCSQCVLLFEDYYARCSFSYKTGNHSVIMCMIIWAIYNKRGLNCNKMHTCYESNSS